MASTDQIPIPADQPLRLRARKDLIASRQQQQGRTHWVLKDPLALRYFRLQPEEHAIFELIDGRKSLEDIHREVSSRFPGINLELGEVWRFVASLFGMGLLLSDGPGMSEHLRVQTAKRKSRQRTASLFNVLAIKLPGIDPTRLLSVISPWVSWIFAPPVVLLAVLLILAAGGLVLVEFEVFQSRLPAFEQFFSLGNAVLLAAALCIAKALHELGHAVSCKRYGGECHEIGVMFLVMTPCLYCDTSDSWMLPGKWKRAAIGAAGMYVELTLAAICTFIWWFSEPGLLNHLALSLMFVSSVSTLVFNANPLMRYDGYYILSDLVEIPNLRTKANALVRRGLMRSCLGIRPPRDPFLPTRNRSLFMTYAVAAFAYRWLIIVAILWFLAMAFAPFGLTIIGQTLAAVAAIGMLAIPLIRGASFTLKHLGSNQVNVIRVAITASILAGLCVAATSVRIPHHVICAIEMQPANAGAVYADSEGQLREIAVSPGQRVVEGEIIATLDNADLSYQIEMLRSQRNAYAGQLQSMRKSRLRDPEITAAMPAIQEALAAVEQQLALKTSQQSLMTIRAPRGGVVLPAPQRRTSDAEDELPSWSGTPLDDANLGCRLAAGDMLCQIVKEDGQAKAVLVIDQGDIEFVKVGQPVTILLAQNARREITGKIASVARKEMSFIPAALSNKHGGEIATLTDQSGMEKAQSVVYQATVLIDDPNGQLLPGLIGQAKITVGERTIVDQVGRYLAQTFRLR